MARQTFSQQVSIIVSSLEVEMKELNLLHPDQSLRFQVGSPTCGNSYWVAVTGGDLGTCVHVIDSLHAASDAGRANWLNTVKAYRNAINRVRRQRATGETLHYSYL